MVGRGMRLAVIVAVVWCAAGEPGAARHPCGGSTFAFGHAGYAAGYGISGVRGFGSGCGWWPRGGVCGPRWGGGWFGRPGLGFGGCSGAWGWNACESVCVTVPSFGLTSFFSGCVPPFISPCGPAFGGWPTNWLPGYAVGPCGWYPYAVPAPVGVGPQFGPAGIVPFLGAATVGTPAATVATPRPAVRLVSEASRRRAARLVAVGDRHLRAAQAGAPARARAAADAYRRAAVAAPDDPDIRVREALALVAVGDPHAADAALLRATAIDGRLAATPSRRGDLPPDPVFGDRPADAPPPLAARGAAIIREIGGADAGDVRWLAARWSARWAGDAAAVASR